MGGEWVGHLSLAGARQGWRVPAPLAGTRDSWVKGEA